MQGKLLNKVTVVTGAGSGIGKSIAKLFAREKSKVYLLDNNNDKGIQTQTEIVQNKNQAKFIHCDVSSEVEVKKAVKNIMQEENRIDIIVNNAAVSHIGNIEQTSPSDMDRLYQINVKSVYLVTREIISTMVKGGGGIILNLASIASKIGLAERFAYSMSKGAVLTMTMSVAKDYIDKNIRCNCICPARVHTPFVDDYLKKNYPGREAELFETLSKYQPIGRMGTPEEIANLALFLCCEDSSFITGTAYDIDGGVMNLK
jgi:NAD(P)-dependent dehydrogenase (short-subunit alcohol dehydrogenase family)